jgi:metallophosphoesterase superfamily enzyme
MPAFGAYAGGLNVLDETFSSLFHWHLDEDMANGPVRRLSIAGKHVTPRLMGYL